MRHRGSGSMTEVQARIGLVTDGWPEDLAQCLNAIFEHAPESIGVDVAVTTDSESSREELRHVRDDVASSLSSSVDVATRFGWHEIGDVGWGSAQRHLLSVGSERYAVVMDVSTIFQGDAVSPLVELMVATGATGAGWRGVNVSLEKQWYEFEDAPAGEVDALLGYLFVVDREAALQSPPSSSARFYRNADMEWSLALRADGGRLYSFEGELPVTQARHRGYYDSDPDFRDEQSRINYLRLLKRFKGRTEILAPRA